MYKNYLMIIEDNIIKLFKDRFNNLFLNYFKVINGDYIYDIVKLDHFFNI